MNGLKFLFICLLLTGCASTAQKQNTALSKGIYAQQQAMQAGRFDLAKKYGEQVAKLVPPPKKAEVINPFISQGKKYVVLPPEFKDLPTIAEGSQPFTIAVNGSKQIQGQLGAESNALEKYSGETAQVLREKDAIVENGGKPSIWQRALSWLKWLSLPLLVIGVGVLCFFVPAAIPFVLTVVSLIGRAFNGIFSAFNNLISRWKK